jgi:dGTPase
LLGEYSAPTELSMPDTTWQQKIAALRGRVMKRLVEEVTSAFAKHHFEILTDNWLAAYCNTALLILS